MAHHFLIFVCTTAFLCSINLLEACTGIQLAAKDGSHVHGRTAEFGVQLDLSQVVIPRGYEFTGTTPKGSGLTYKAKYAAVGMTAYGNNAILDGMNEKGLSVGAFYFPGFAKYSVDESQYDTKGLSPADFINWVVTQFATTEEVKGALDQVVITPTVIKGWGPTPPPFHYIVYDQKGNSLVIEPLDGDLVTYENKLGVITNSPTFDWHMTNLRNYINLTPFNVKPLRVEGILLAPFGQGSGMVGLPGDFTPPSRFVRASIFCITATPSSNAEKAVLQAFHILNQFDIPVGIAKEKVGEVVYTDYTLFTCVKDPQSLKYFFRSYEDQTIRSIDLNEFDLNAETIKSANLAEGTQSIYDVSSQLK